MIKSTLVDNHQIFAHAFEDMLLTGVHLKTLQRQPQIQTHLCCQELGQEIFKEELTKIGNVECVKVTQSSKEIEEN